MPRAFHVCLDKVLKLNYPSRNNSKKKEIKIASRSIDLQSSSQWQIRSTGISYSTGSGESGLVSRDNRTHTFRTASHYRSQLINRVACPSKDCEWRIAPRAAPAEPLGFLPIRLRIVQHFAVPLTTNLMTAILPTSHTQCDAMWCDGFVCGWVGWLTISADRALICDTIGIIMCLRHFWCRHSNMLKIGLWVDIILMGTPHK